MFKCTSIRESEKLQEEMGEEISIYLQILILELISISISLHGSSKSYLLQDSVAA